MGKRAAVDTEIEQALVGGLLMRADVIWELEIGVHQLGHPPARAAVAAVMQLVQDGETVDALTVERAAGGHGVTVDWLIQAMGQCATTEALPSYARRIKELAVERKVRQLGHDLVGSDLEGDELTALAERGVEGIRAEVDVGDGTVSAAEGAKEVAEAALAPLDERSGGLLTGVWEWDRFGECDLGDLLIIGGITSMGKSQLLAWARQGYVNQGERVAVITTESKRQKVFRRDLSLLSGVNSRKMKRGGQMNRDELDRFSDAVQSYNRQPIWVNDKLFDIDDIVRWARFMRERNGVTVFQLDHLQLMQARAMQGSSPREVMNYILSRWSQFGHEGQGVYIQAVSQLKRAADRGGDLPRLSDHQESGRIEQDAQVVCMPHRPFYFDSQKDATELLLLWPKVRDGETGRSYWVWDFKLGQPRGPRAIDDRTQHWESTGR